MEPASSTITSADLLRWQLDLTSQLSATNAQYIGIAVTIILAIGGVFYLLTLRPFEKELERQSNEIKSSSDQLNEILKAEFLNLKGEVEQISGSIKIETQTALSVAESAIISKITPEIATTSAQIREEISKEARSLDTKINQIEVNNVATSKDVSLIKSKLITLQASIDDVEMRLRDVEIYRYSQEGKMGSITIPLRTIEELLDKPTKDWRIPNLLSTLKKEVAGTKLESEMIVNITGVLSKLPSKYDIPREEILQLMRK